jgi:hypothetical protein
MTQEGSASWTSCSTLCITGNQIGRTLFQLSRRSPKPLMLHNRHFRKRSCCFPWSAALVCIVALTLLLARTASPSFSQTSSPLQSTAKCETTHAKRQCLDHDDGFQASLPTQAFKTSPPPISFSQLALANEPPPPLQSKGFRYNRPPPLS